MLVVVACAAALPAQALAQGTPPTPPTPAAAPAQLRLEDAVRYAVSRNERARISDLNVDVADAAVEKARAAFLPIITMTGSDVQHANGPPHPPNIGTSAVTLNQPILNASAFPLYSQAKALADAQRAQNIDDKRLLAFNAATAFFAVLNAEDVVHAASNQLDMAKASFADASGRAQAQLASSNDVTRAQIDLSDAQRELEADKGLVDNAYVSLAFVLNWPVSAGSLVAPSATLTAAQQPTPKMDWLVGFAMAHRPDLLVAKHQLTAAQYFADEPLLRLVPVLGLQASASGTTNTPPSGFWYDALIGVTATWTIFDGGVRYADKHSRDAQEEIADLSLQQLVRNVDAQIRSAVALLVSSQLAYQQAGQAAASAKQSADETAILYRRDLAKMIELQDAKGARFTAEVNLATAEFSMAQAYLALRQALGLEALGTDYR